MDLTKRAFFLGKFFEVCHLLHSNQISSSKGLRSMKREKYINDGRLQMARLQDHLAAHQGPWLPVA